MTVVTTYMLYNNHILLSGKLQLTVMLLLLYVCWDSSYSSL